MGYTRPETKRKWTEANRDRVNANQRASYAANREHRLALQKGYNEKNAEVISARRKAAYAANPNKYKEKTLKARHGLTIREYDEMLEAQGGHCATCTRTSPGGRAKLFHVDHDHTCCGKVKSCKRCRRGLLCGGCNVGIGMLQDDPEILLNAVAYLQRAGR